MRKTMARQAVLCFVGPPHFFREVVRGLHHQVRHLSKLGRAMVGQMLDVFVDLIASKLTNLRRGIATFFRSRPKTLRISPGLAHGFSA